MQKHLIRFESERPQKMIFLKIEAHIYDVRVISSIKRTLQSMKLNEPHQNLKQI